MNALLLLALVALALADANFGFVHTTVTPVAQKSLAEIAAGHVRGAGAWCSSCVSFIDQAINQLLNIILNGGVIGSCAELCGNLPEKLEQEVCNVLCDVVGIEAFIKLISAADPDPIYICEELDQLCPVNNQAAANLTALTVSPTSGQQGTTFNIHATFKVTKEIGTGQFVLACLTPAGDGEPFGDASLLVEVPPGVYNVNSQLQANPSKNEPFNPGQFQILAQVCEGSCGSIWPHTKLLSQKTANFKITP